MLGSAIKDMSHEGQLNFMGALDFRRECFAV